MQLAVVECVVFPCDEPAYIYGTAMFVKSALGVMLGRIMLRDLSIRLLGSPYFRSRHFELSSLVDTENAMTKTHP
jgi:hypothetical protein